MSQLIKEIPEVSSKSASGLPKCTMSNQKDKPTLPNIPNENQSEENHSIVSQFLMVSDIVVENPLLSVGETLYDPCQDFVTFENNLTSPN